MVKNYFQKGNQSINDKILAFDFILLLLILSLGISHGSLDHLKGGNPKQNAEIILSILKGDKGYKRDIVVLNAAFGIKLGGVKKNDGFAFLAKIQKWPILARIDPNLGISGEKIFQSFF